MDDLNSQEIDGLIELGDRLCDLLVVTLYRAGYGVSMAYRNGISVWDLREANQFDGTVTGAKLLGNVNITGPDNVSMLKVGDVGKFRTKLDMSDPKCWVQLVQFFGKPDDEIQMLYNNDILPGPLQDHVNDQQ